MEREMGVSVVAQTSLWSRYTAKAELVGAAVMRTASDAGAATLLAEASGPGYVCTASVASRFPQVAAGARPSDDAAAVPATAAEPAAARTAATGHAASAEPAATTEAAAGHAAAAKPAAAAEHAAATEQAATTAQAAAAAPAAATRHAAADEGGTVAAEVVTVAPFAVAETGSVALDEPRADRGRCFLAERLWVLVPDDAIVATLDEGLARLQALVVETGAHHPLLMTGPSRTADIERTLTVGVHGPRALVIVVVGQA
jgi:L-lactate dehydrogenase complex protein LldG